MNVVNVHGSCVVLGRAADGFGGKTDAGVLILGESGAGKSQLALQLIARGAKLVADDRVELFAREEQLWARAPAQLAGLMEARGIGIVPLAFVEEAHVTLAIRMVGLAEVPRLPEEEDFDVPSVLGLPPQVRPPLLRLSARDDAAAEKAALAASLAATGRFGRQRPGI